MHQPKQRQSSTLSVKTSNLSGKMPKFSIVIIALILVTATLTQANAITMTDNKQEAISSNQFIKTVINDTVIITLQTNQTNGNIMPTNQQIKIDHEKPMMTNQTTNDTRVIENKSEKTKEQMVLSNQTTTSEEVKSNQDNYTGDALAESSVPKKSNLHIDGLIESLSESQILIEQTGDQDVGSASKIIIRSSQAVGNSSVATIDDSVQANSSAHQLLERSIEQHKYDSPFINQPQTLLHQESWQNNHTSLINQSNDKAQDQKDQILVQFDKVIESNITGLPTASVPIQNQTIIIQTNSSLNSNISSSVSNSTTNQLVYLNANQSNLTQKETNKVNDTQVKQYDISKDKSIQQLDQPHQISQEKDNQLKETNQSLLEVQSQEMPNHQSMVLMSTNDKANLTQNKTETGEISSNGTSSSSFGTFVEVQRENEAISQPSYTKTPQACPTTPMQPEEILEQFLKRGNDFDVQLSESGTQSLSQTNPSDDNFMSFYIVPQDPKNSISKEIQILSSDHIIKDSDNTSLAVGEDIQMINKEGLLYRSLVMQKDQDDYYNVTVNFIVKKGGASKDTIQQSSASKTINVSDTNQNNGSVVQQLSQVDGNNQKDAAKVDPVSDSSKSAFEAAAQLDIINQDAKQEIAEAEHYMSGFASLQASKPDDYQDVASQQKYLTPQDDIQTQIKDSINKLDTSSLVQVQTDMNLKPISQQINKKRLVQIRKSTAKQVKKVQKQSHRMSADAFDAGDGSTHIDKDFDYDMAQVQAAKVQVLTEKLAAQQGLSQQLQQNDIQNQSMQNEPKQFTQQDVTRLNQLKREVLEAKEHKQWMQKLAQKGLAYTDNSTDQNQQSEEEQQIDLQSQQINAQQQQKLKSQGLVQSKSANQQNIKQISIQKYQDTQKLNKPKLVSIYTGYDGNVLQNEQDQQVVAQQQSQQDQQLQEEEETTDQSTDSSNSNEQIMASKEEQSNDFRSDKKQQGLSQQQSGEDTQEEEQKESSSDEETQSDSSRTKQKLAHSSYDNAVHEQEEQWSKEAEDATGNTEIDDESGQVRQKHSHFVTQKSQEVEPYEIPAEDHVIYDQEQKLQEMVEEEKAAKKMAAIKAQRESLRKETEREEAIESEKQKLIAQIEAQNKIVREAQQAKEEAIESEKQKFKDQLDAQKKAEREARKVKEKKLLEQRDFLREKLKKQQIKQQLQEQEQSIEVESQDQKLANEQNRIEQHIKQEIQLLDDIVKKRKMEGAKNLHKMKIVTEDLDQQANDDNLKQLKLKKAHDLEILQEQEQEKKQEIQKEKAAQEEESQKEQIKQQELQKEKAHKEELFRQKLKQDEILHEQAAREQEFKRKEAHEKEIQRKKASQQARAQKAKEQAEKKKAMEAEREQQEVEELEEEISRKEQEVQQMSKIQKKKEDDFENEMRHEEIIKKRTARLSEDFEFEENPKQNRRENQIKMLEAQKRQLQHADNFEDKVETFDQKEKVDNFETKKTDLDNKQKTADSFEPNSVEAPIIKSQPDNSKPDTNSPETKTAVKENKKKKQTKWPKMEILDNQQDEAKIQPVDIKQLLNLHQKSSSSTKELENESNITAKKNSSELLLKKQDMNVKAIVQNQATKLQSKNKTNEIVKKVQMNQQKTIINKMKQITNTTEEDSSIQKTQDELKQIQRDLEEAQYQAEMYQKEKEHEELKKTKIIEQIEKKTDDIKNLEKNTNDGNMSLTIFDEEAQDTSMLSQEEKEAIDQVIKAKEQGEKNGAEAAKKLIDQAKDQSMEENDKSFKQLKDKLKNTSDQVINIVQNFQRVHTDLQDLKEEYIQQKLQETENIQQQGDNSQVQISEEMHSESLEVIQSSIQQKKNELKKLMTNFSEIKQELKEIAQQKQRMESNQQLIQLDQLRMTLDQTIVESERVGNEDLVKLDETVHSQVSHSVRNNEQETIVDEQN